MRDSRSEPEFAMLLLLSSRFHDQVSQPFTLSQANAGELQAELLAVDPAHDGLIEPKRPLKIV